MLPVSEMRTSTETNPIEIWIFGFVTKLSRFDKCSTTHILVGLLNKITSAEVLTEQESTNIMGYKHDYPIYNINSNYNPILYMYDDDFNHFNHMIGKVVTCKGFLAGVARDATKENFNLVIDWFKQHPELLATQVNPIGFVDPDIYRQLGMKSNNSKNNLVDYKYQRLQELVVPTSI